MTSARRPLVAGNWKMNGLAADGLALARSLAAAAATIADDVTLAGAVATMRQLNRAGGEVMVEAGVKSATDITGFGLAGHLLGMLKASRTAAKLRFSDIPLLPGVRELAERGVVPGGTRNNLDAFDAQIDWSDGITDEEKLIFCDAQTSGGLLISVPSASTQAVLDGLAQRGVTGAIIGRVVAEEEAANTVEVTA